MLDILLLRPSVHFTTLHPTFVMNDERLPSVKQAPSQGTRALYTTRKTLKFAVCVHQHNSTWYIAPTNNNPVIPSLASSPPHCAIHAPKPRGSSRGLPSAQGVFLLFIIRVRKAASKLYVNTILREINKPNNL